MDRKTARREVSEEKIEATLPDEYVTVDGESWSIDGWAEYQLSVKDHKTDLEKGNRRGDR